MTDKEQVQPLTAEQAQSAVRRLETIDNVCGTDQPLLKSAVRAIAADQHVVVTADQLRRHRERDEKVKQALNKCIGVLSADNSKWSIDAALKARQALALYEQDKEPN